MKSIITAIFVMLQAFCSLTMAQQFLMDKPVSAGELTLFPSIDNQNEFYYLPDKIQIGRHPDGSPQFSFIKYVKNTDATGGSDVITESNDAGGIVHAVVALDVSEEQLKEASQALRRVKSAGKIVGPVVYKSGTVALISSFNKAGENVETVVGLGTAPILENQKAAVSVHLNQRGADILWATFETPTPDFSISFEMEIEGFLSPKRAKITANWERVYDHKAFEAAVASPMLSGEIKMAFDELRDQGAIKVEQVGEDEQMDALIQTAYTQLTNLMFDKVAGSGVPKVNELFPGSDKSMLDRATETLRHHRKEAIDYNTKMKELENKRFEHEAKLKSELARARQQQFAQSGGQYQAPARVDADGNAMPERNREENKNNQNQQRERMSVPEMSIALSFKMKKEKRSGEFVIDLNKYTKDLRSSNFVENFGSFINMNACPSCFKRVNLYDPLYTQRNIHIRVDGSVSADDFGKYLNGVEVSIRKKHENGQMTLKGVQINKKLFVDEANDFVVNYGWNGDDNRDKWLEYEYRTKWSFFGGASFETEWQTGEDNVIGLAPQLVRKPIYIEADFEELKGVRSAEVKLISKINGKEVTQNVSLSKKTGQSSKTVDLVMSRDSDEFEYEIVYFVKGKGPKVMPRQSSTYGRIYLD